MTAPRSRLCSSPSANTQSGCQPITGISGESGVTRFSWNAVQRRESRENRDGVRMAVRFAECPRISHAGRSPCSSTGATSPCSARSFSYRPAGSASASGPYSRRRSSAPNAWAGQPGGGVREASSANGVVTVSPESSRGGRRGAGPRGRSWPRRRAGGRGPVRPRGEGAPARASGGRCDGWGEPYLTRHQECFTANDLVPPGRMCERLVHRWRPSGDGRPDRARAPPAGTVRHQLGLTPGLSYR